MKSVKYILVAVFIFIFSFQAALASIGLKGAFDNAITAGDEAGYNPSDSNDVFIIIAFVINAIIGLLSIIFMLLMIYGGYLWMTARGNEEVVEKSKKIIIAAVVGLIIVLSAYVISYFVVEAIGGATLQKIR